MKIIYIPSIKILFTVILINCFQFKAFTQSAENAKIKPSKIFFGIALGPTQSQIDYTRTLSSPAFLTSKMDAFDGSAEVGYILTKNISLLSGIGFSSVNSQLALDNYEIKFTTTDLENETYQRQVNGTGIKEAQDIGLLTVPIGLSFHIPINKAIGFFFDPGINLAIPLIKNYTSSGTFTYKGYYSAYNALLENLPDYGFPTNFDIATNGELELNPLVVNVIASSGLYYTIKKNFQLAISVRFSQSLTNISAYKGTETFLLSNEVDKINSLMGSSSKVSVRSVGINVIFRYFLK